jgi:polysaccharide deacetylase 2 family uncharacterized protein YibQ
MAKRRRKKTNAGTPFRVKLLVAFLICIVVFGIGWVKLFQTTRGRLNLLDAGLVVYYNHVQDELDDELRVALRSAGLQRDLHVRVARERHAGRELLVRRWETICRSDCSAAKIGLAFTKALDETGASAHSSIVEWQHGAVSGEDLVIQVGSRRFPTHHIEVRMYHDIAPPALRPQMTPRLALVIDDFGYAKTDLSEAFLDLDVPLTISVIPSLARTRYAIEGAHQRNKEAILHVPMEAEEEPQDGPSVLTTMSDEEITILLNDYLDDNPGVVGINNHMGSKATRDPRVMTAVISVLKRRDLFFFDSLTSTKSIAYNTAKSMSVPTTRNDMFLDADTEDAKVVEERLQSLIRLARRKGVAVGIGHPKRWTYEAIKRNEEVLKRSGVQLVFVSDLME